MGVESNALKEPGLDVEAPLVSVIIPAYNAERTVGAAVSSVLAQTHPRIEVIVIDDGSVDATAVVIDEIATKDTRVRRIGQKNQGVSGARNRGIDVAKGDWIALLDADDTFAPDRVERLLSLARKYTADMLADNLSVSTAVDAAASRYHAFPDNRMLVGGPIDPTFFVRCDRPKWGLQSAGFIKPLIRRAFLIDSGVRYPSRISAGEDFHFYVMSLIHGARLHFAPDALYEYTLQPVSLSHGDDDRVIGDHVAVSRQLKSEAASRNLHALVAELDHREREMINWLAFMAVTRELKAGHYLASCRAFFRLPSPLDGIVRLLAMFRYNTAVRLGITLQPKLPKS